MLKIISCVVLAGLAAQAFAANSPTPNTIGYYENWDVYASPSYPFDGANGISNPDLGYKLARLNTISYAFMEVDSNGVVQFSDTWSDLSSSDQNFCTANSVNTEICNGANFDPAKTNVHFGNFGAFANSSVPVRLVSIGGASHEASWQNAMTYPTSFVNSIVALVNNYKLSGVDIDYEPLGGNNYNSANFVSLITQLRSALGKNAVITLSTFTSGQSLKNFLSSDQWVEVKDQVNFINIMGYDMHGEFDSPPVTGLQSALYTGSNTFSDDDAVQTLTGFGISPAQLILGYPSYGRAVGGVSSQGIGQPFTTSFQGDLDPSNCVITLGAQDVCSGMVSYNWILSQSLSPQYINVNGAVSGAYANFGNNFISYDDPNSIKAKAQYTLSNQLGGMMTWALRFDAPAVNADGTTNPQSLLSTVDSSLGITPRPYTPPTPSKSIVLEIHNTASNAGGVVVHLYDSVGGAFAFPGTSGGFAANQDTVYCSKAAMASNPKCVASWNLDNMNFSKGTMTSVDVMAPGALKPLACNLIDLSKSYNQVMTYNGSNCVTS